MDTTSQENFTLHFNVVDAAGDLKTFSLQLRKDAQISPVVDHIAEAAGICRDSLRLVGPNGTRLRSEGDTIQSEGWPLEDGARITCLKGQQGRKPVIYLFSPKSIDASVQLSLVPEWEFSVLYPVVPIERSAQHSNQQVSWNVKVHSNGELTHLTTGLDVSYLFWEAHTVPRLLESPPPSPTLGTREETFVPNSATVTDDDAVLLSVDKITPYLDASLKALGLHTEARTSFITYWLPSFLKHKHVALRFLPQAAYEKTAPLSVSPAPDVVTRIFMLFKGVSDNELPIWPRSVDRCQKDISFWADRVGVDLARTLDAQLFRVIEWGGMEL